MDWQVWPGEWYLDAGALLIAVALDLAFRELPGSLHPVVWMGKLIGWLEKAGPSADSRLSVLAWGGCMACLVPALFGGGAWLAANGLRELGPLPYLLGVGAMLSTTFAVSGLARAAKDVRNAMDDGHIGEAREGLRSLVSRDANALSTSLASAAAIESVAENTTDSFIGPWLAFALLGLPGAFAFRAVNTLDSMIGYRGKYEYLGKVSARLDDLLNLAPARLSAAIMLGGGALCRLPAVRGWQWAWAGQRMTSSPNAGWTIGAMSGLLGVALEKQGHYRIGEGLEEPGPEHIGLSVRVAYAVAFIGIPIAVGVLAARGLLTG